jgi:hypothetical protein
MRRWPIYAALAASLLIFLPASGAPPDTRASSLTSWVTDLNPTQMRSANPADGLAPLFGGRVNALAVDPADPKTVYAASEAGGVFVSRNGGASWHHVDAIAMAMANDVKYMPGRQTDDDLRGR